MALFERFAAHQGEVGGLPISRALPLRQRRTIGAWCFLDHAGPATLPPGAGMRVGPHPHTGLQTFSWMMEGEILHRDSLGHEQLLRPGQVNLMTAGSGISHSEESRTDRLHLAQLWIALPDSQRFGPAAFQHYPDLPQLGQDGYDLTVLVGSYGGHTAPVQVHTPLLGLDIIGRPGAETKLALAPGFEQGLMVTEGEVELEIDGQVETLAPGELLYIAPGPQQLRLSNSAACRLMLLGGPPWEGELLLWWNFVGRTPAEIQQFAADWNAGRGDFGEVKGFDGPRLLAPEVPPLRSGTR
ncbi:MAG: pirin family protein [Burkholderiaceae bacterium]